MRQPRPRGRRLFPTALVAAVMASACNPVAESQPGSATVINVSVSLGDESELRHFDELLRRFELRHESDDRTPMGRFRRQPHVQVNRVSQPDRLVDVLTNQQTGRQTPGVPMLHLVAVDNVDLWRLGADGLLEELSPLLSHLYHKDRYLASRDSSPFSEFLAMQERYFPCGKFLLPLRFNARLAYANRNDLDAVQMPAPTTLEELRRVASALREAKEGLAPVTLSLAGGDPAAVTMSELILAHGGDPLVLDDEGSVRAFRFVQDMWKQGLISDLSIAAKFDTELEFLRKGDTSVAQNWSYTSARLRDADRLNEFEVRAGWAGPGGARHVIGGDVLGIPKRAGVDDAEKRAAQDLTKFLLSQESQEFLARKNAWAPIRDDAFSGVPQMLRPTFDAIRAALEDGWYRPAVPYWRTVSSSMTSAVRRIVLGGEDAARVLGELQDEIASEAGRFGAISPRPCR